MDLIQSRRPDFNKMYPNRSSFRRSTNEDVLSDTATLMEAHGRTVDLPKLENFEFDALRNDRSRSLRSFNMRRYSDELLRSIGPKIVPAAHGRIEHLLITVPYSSNDLGQPTISSRHERHYRAFFSHFLGNREITVLCHPNHVAQIQTWFTSSSGGDNVRFVLSPRFSYSIWAQDAYVAITEQNGGDVLAEGVLFPRYDDMTIADDVSLQSPVSVLQSSLYFQGGNVLGGPTKTIIGQDYIWKNQTRVTLETSQVVLDKFKSTFGTDIIPIGGARTGSYSWYESGVLSGYGYQPIFHLDMYITPTGVVGPSGKEIVLLGRPSKAHAITGRWVERSNPADTFDFSQYDDFFDETEAQLSNHFEVRHLPLQLTWGNLQIPRLEKQYYILSFNNVVIENYTAADGSPVRNVIMTTYAQDAAAFGMDPGIRRDLEDEAERIWKDLGFKVFRMDGMEDLAYGLGSIHCITKDLRRSTFP